MRTESVIAVDLGASGGRCLLGRSSHGRLQLQEIYRFPNRPMEFGGHLHWNVASLYEEIKAGLAKCAAFAGRIHSVGLDTWGVDYALLGPGDGLLGLPFCYRDDRTAGRMEEVFSHISRPQLYAETGIQNLPFNTIFQLYAAARLQPETLHITQRFLMIPDLFAFLLTGEKACEYTNASTTQMLSLTTRNWSERILRALGLPTSMFAEPVAPGTVLGRMRTELRSGGLAETVFTCTATHDTASAIAAIPLSEPAAAYISCGTWSLLGRELRSPLTTSAALAHDFTNEGGVANTIRFLKNIQGMWVLHQCQQEWAHQGHAISSAALVRAAREARPFGLFIDLDDASLLNARSMLRALELFCRRTRQKFDRRQGAVARAVYESLALKHRRTLRILGELTGTPATVIHIVGGGSRNPLVCQWTSDATGIPVIAGPTEATAIGNILVQGMALGWFSDWSAARRAVAGSVEFVHYEPRSHDAWLDAEERFDRLLARSSRRAARA